MKKRGIVLLTAFVVGVCGMVSMAFDNQNVSAATMMSPYGTGMPGPGNGGTSSPVYRFYNAATGSHFYTISEGERSWCQQNLPVMRYEGPAYHAFTTNEPGTSPVHRFYNTVSGTHFYTMSAGEKDWILQNLPTMRYEGISYYAFMTNEPGTSPVHRFYNTWTGTHFYTISDAERDWIMQNLPVMHYEGIAYYAQSSTAP